jgi:hypothetical protein
VPISAPPPGAESNAQHEPRGDPPASGDGRQIVITRRAALDCRDGINIFFALADAFDRDGDDVAIVATTVGDRDRIQRLFAGRLPVLPR